MKATATELTPEQKLGVDRFVGSYTLSDVDAGLRLLNRLEIMLGMSSGCGSGTGQRCGQFTWNFVIENFVLPKGPVSFPELFHSDNIDQVNAMLFRVETRMRIHLELLTDKSVHQLNIELCAKEWQES